MSPALTEIACPPPSLSREEKRRRFINAYWLRPENAYWMVLRSNALDAVPIRKPFADLSCGDGVFSFLHAGGRFDSEFDVFRGAGRLDQALSSGADMYDHIDDAYKPAIVEAPVYTIDCGTDLKQTLLDKASRLSFYDHLIAHDNNASLPFEDESLETVYCNSTYWVEHVDAFLAEMHRVTRGSGTIVLHVKLDAIEDCTLERYQGKLGKRWMEIIGGDRFSSWPTLCDRSEWEHRFERAGLEIVEATPFVTGTHAHIWNVGLRPVAPLLTKSMNAIHEHLRAEIKRDWVDMFCDLLDPFCEADFDLFAEGSEPVEIQYVLQKRS